MAAETDAAVEPDDRVLAATAFADDLRTAFVRPGRPELGPEPRRPLGRLRLGLLRAGSRIRSAIVWRALYALLARRGTVKLAARALSCTGTHRALAVVGRIEEATVWSGWPHQAPGWINLDLSRFTTRLRLELEAAPRVVARRPRRDPAPLRVGLAAEMSVFVTFSADHFRGVPEEIELTVFDTEYAGRNATYLADTGVAYRQFGHEDDEATREALLAAIDEAQLDLLLMFLAPQAAAALAARVDTPCVAHMPMGSDLYHHPRMGFHLFVQPEADYFVREGRLFCGTSRSPFGDELVIPGSIVYDTRGIADRRPAPWAARKPLIVFHGALYKLASEPYLDVIFRLLEDDPQAEFVFMGRGKNHEPRLAAIMASASARGLASRVHYDGAYARFRDEHGTSIADPGWERLAAHLRSARLAPNPFPMGGGAARVEAYVLGAPTVHMGVRFDAGAWGRPQWSIVDLPVLQVQRATAYDLRAYTELCSRCLHDEAFADAVAAEQAAVAERVTDAAAFWRQIVAAYRTWERTQ